MVTPKYRLTYKDFPEIPFPKRWNDQNITDEQIITKKLLEKQPITEDERNKILECIEFYHNVIPKLKTFDLKTLDEQEIQDFLEYYQYVFTYLVAQTNDLYISRMYRLVDNESVLGKRERIRERKHLSYPPEDLVNSKKRYNRVNTPEFNIFYASFSIDDVLLETKPVAGQLITIGLWLPATGDEVKLISYPICPNPIKFKVNKEATGGYFAFQKLSNEIDPLLYDFLNSMYSFVNDEYAKSVSHHLEYLYSALFSKSVFEIENGPNPLFNYECIIYPSIGNNLEAQNIALKPNTIDRKFKLCKVIEFEITNTFYDRKPPRNYADAITVVEYKNLNTTDWVEREGYIVW